MSTGLPRVKLRKRFMSCGNRQGSALLRPMTPFCAMATMSETRGAAALITVDYCPATGRRASLDLDCRVKNHDVAERHAKELRGLRTVLLHTGKQPALQTPQSRQRSRAYHVPPHEERAVLGKHPQAAAATGLERFGDIGSLHEAEARGDEVHPRSRLVDP